MKKKKAQPITPTERKVLRAARKWEEFDKQIGADVSNINWIEVRKNHRALRAAVRADNAKRKGKR